MSIRKPPRFTKRTIAQTQLYRAVKLLGWDSPDFDPISALTLAGAAEEVLGKMVEAKGKEPAFEAAKHGDRLIWDLKLACAKEEGRKVSPPDFKAIGRQLNRTRNELKHNDGGKNSPVTAYIVEEAEDMVLRAIENYQKLYGKLPPQKEVQGWYDWITL